MTSSRKPRRRIKPRIRFYKGRWVTSPPGFSVHLYDYGLFQQARAYCRLLNARRAT